MDLQTQQLLFLWRDCRIEVRKDGEEANWRTWAFQRAEKQGRGEGGQELAEGVVWARTRDYEGRWRGIFYRLSNNYSLVAILGLPW